MRIAVFLAVIMCISTTSVENRKKRSCEKCKAFSGKLDRILEKGEELVKVIELEHDSPEKICTDIHLCTV
ncbi:surfactant protein B [Ancylostoma duodenale]|uniref:Surfactant protein B n=1 Tax=Ancylostoma duodenale TaxID=51022 RepID=A0A0C2D1F6_9BILA|nr:surfactant protein B [Ancylostoma duodenale]